MKRCATSVITMTSQKVSFFATPWLKNIEETVKKKRVYEKSENTGMKEVGGARTRRDRDRDYSVFKVGNSRDTRKDQKPNMLK